MKKRFYCQKCGGLIKNRLEHAHYCVRCKKESVPVNLLLREELLDKVREIKTMNNSTLSATIEKMLERQLKKGVSQNYFSVIPPNPKSKLFYKKRCVCGKYFVPTSEGNDLCKKCK